MKRYLLVGYFGFGNLGDEECLKITRDFLKNECNGMTRVLSRRGLSECGKEYSRARFRDIINAIRCSDAVILCGGNLLQNETSNKSLMFYCEIIRLAAMLRRKIYAISSGFGEVNGWCIAM